MIDEQRSLSPPSGATAHRGFLTRFRQWWDALPDTRDPWTSDHRPPDRRALRLLNSNLSQQQRDQLEKRGHFEVTGGSTGRRYRIRHGQQMNVEVLDRKGKPAFVLCFVPEGHLADGDIMLAQKIALELFENEAITVANKIPTPLRRLHPTT